MSNQLSGSKAPLSERFFVNFFRAVAAFGRFRANHPFWGQLAVGLVTFSSTTILQLQFLPLLPVYDPALPTKFIYALGWRALVSLVVAAFVNRLILSGLLPALRYSPQSIAMGNMGLELISAGEDRYAEIVKHYLKKHDCAKSGHVRIICISGRYLFREKTMPNGKLCPLHELGKKGQIDVVMPVSHPKNPTIESRFGTYSADFKSSRGMRTPDDLVHDVQKGKEFLSDHSANILTEHGMLCIWRVVLFKEHCVVQSYFPNTQSQESYLAPVFVFANRREVIGSYYETFETMFNLVKQYGAMPLSSLDLSTTGANMSFTGQM